MTDQHPITPPPELVRQWGIASPCKCDNTHWAYEQFIAAEAAQWGADQELEACRMFLAEHPGLEHPNLLWELLYIARRPKPPSLKEQALQILKKHVDRGCMTDEAIADADILRRALEDLPDD